MKSPVEVAEAAVEAAAPRLQVQAAGLSPVQAAALLVLFPPVMPAFAPNYLQPLLLQIDPSWL